MKQFDSEFNMIEDYMKFLRMDNIGPIEENECLEENPDGFYSTGILWPQKTKKPTLDVEEEEYLTADSQVEILEGLRDDIQPQKSFLPASMGLSFRTFENDTLKIYIKFAYYDMEFVEIGAKSEEQSEIEKYTRNKRVWKRRACEYNENFSIQLMKNGIFKKRLKEGLTLQVNKRNIDATFLTVSLINESLSLLEESEKVKDEMTKKIFFQCEISVHSKNGFCPLNENIYSNEIDRKPIELLYNEVKRYSIGHGCSSVFYKENQVSNLIKTTFLPNTQLKVLMPNTDFDYKSLYTDFLSNAPKEEIVENLYLITSDYESWIKKFMDIEDNNEISKKIISDNIDSCIKINHRIKEGIKFICQNDFAFRSFRLLNKSMQMIGNGKNGLKKWYLFQLVFILINIKAVVDEGDFFREEVDLLWFPTGGGKTEAYLGLTAFCLFYRKITYHEKGAGMAVFTRYTLRLLTIQQFQRTSKLVLACEVLRRMEGLDGPEFSIGLWVGSKVTPNVRSIANESIKKLMAGEKFFEENPYQIFECPWCGENLTPKDYNFIYEEENEIKCPNVKCPFHRSMPLYIIDEDIYKVRPSVLISTLDKFATIPLVDKTCQLFSTDGKHRKPDLIIQDELHLISGPLGSLSGLYETMVDELCRQTSSGRRPKIITSTATISYQKQQVKALFNREVNTFPQHVNKINDSFFAIEASAHRKAPRYYLGVKMPSTTMLEAAVKILALDLFCSRRNIELYPKDKAAIDNLWTLLGYFNTLRELGNLGSIIHTRVRERYIYLAKTKFKKYCNQDILMKNSYFCVEELTGRKSSSEIISTLAKLDNSYDSKYSFIDVLLSSNMFSVGLDVSRMNNMILIGQPMLNAEYIQATGRVGRNSPGVILVLYNPLRARDNSFYEDFYYFHQTMHKNVEASTQTPFSKGALEKGLHAVYVGLIRALIPDLRGEKDAKNLNKLSADNKKIIRRIEQRIIERIRQVSPQNVNKSKEIIRKFKQKWVDLCENNLRYSTKTLKNPCLLKPDERNYYGLPDTMTSLRNVEKEVIIMDDFNHQKGKIRQSYLTSYHSSGSIVNLPSGSFIISGIDLWKYGEMDKKHRIYNEYLQKIINVDFFMSPPSSDSSNTNVPAFTFPMKFYCTKCGRIYHYEKLKKVRFKCPPCNRKTESIAFLLACKKGHIEDFPFFWWIHKDEQSDCSDDDMRILISDKKSGIEGVTIFCNRCKKNKSMKSVFSGESFTGYACKGKMPWLRDQSNEMVKSSLCDLNVSVHLRNSTGLYQPKTMSSLVIPPWSSRDQKIIYDFFEMLLSSRFSINQKASILLKFTGRLLNEIEVSELIKNANAIKSFRQKSTKFNLNDMIELEYDALSRDIHDELISTEQMKISDRYKDFLEKVVAVNKITETKVFFGFNRTYSEIENYQLNQSLLDELNSNVGKHVDLIGGNEAKQIAPISYKNNSWIPGIELSGEGIFIRFNNLKIREWESQANSYYEDMIKASQKNQSLNKNLNSKYILIHSLSHAIMKQLSIVSGYPISSIKEKIYCSEDPFMAGVLLYTTSNDINGSLGGLVQHSDTFLFERLLNDSINNLQWCSSDPLCASTKLKQSKSKIYAACHNCLLLPETCCEAGNSMLDRNAIIGDVVGSLEGYFINKIEHA
jgi:predicted RNA-binding Zn-ribbon protein involved in translation (DUF1610 family)